MVSHPTGARHPTLPQELLHEIDDKHGTNYSKKKNARARLSRKDARKQERVEKKRRKADFFSSTSASAAPKRQAVIEHPESPQRKKAKIDPAPTSKKPDQAASESHRKSSKTALEKLVEKKAPKKGAVPTLINPQSKVEREEDAYIAYLEAKLGYNRGKALGGDADDGLGDLLDFTNSISPPGLEGGSDLDVSEEELSGEGSEVIEDESEGASEIEGASETNEEYEEWNGCAANSSGSEDGREGMSEEEGEEKIDESNLSEKPAVRNTQTGSVKYVPPQLRNKPSERTNSESLVKLQRLLNGLINRMSEPNLTSIVDGIEEAYRKHSRHDVLSVLTNLLINGIAAHAILLDSYVVLHAALVASLHRVIGIEFAAYFVQNLIQSYETRFASESLEGKEATNLLVLISELYNFQVISCTLIYDIIRDLLAEDLSEFRVELLLKIVKNSGIQLRQDDPSSLKDIVQIVQNKLTDKNQALSSRTKFMIETLTNLKNNKMKHSSGSAITPGSSSDAVERMKKFLSNLGKKRAVHAHDPLRFSLAELRSASTKGKWWLVGAAWGGDPLLERHEQRHEEPAESQSAESSLLKLARKQGMNTDIRRSIFVVLMSSDDYVDAHERLSQLKLTEIQQREIMRVILHCCGNEKTYNPYYTLVAQHLCQFSHSHKVTLQFCLWDFLRELGETGVGGAEMVKNLADDSDDFDGDRSISSLRVKNIAKAYSWWIARGKLTLMILKPLDFTTLRPHTRTFLKDLFIQLFIYTQSPTPLATSLPPAPWDRKPLEEVFIKVAKAETLSMGLVHCISNLIMKHERKDDKFIKWACNIASDTLQTGVDVLLDL